MLKQEDKEKVLIELNNIGIHMNADAFDCMFNECGSIEEVDQILVKRYQSCIDSLRTTCQKQAI